MNTPDPTLPAKMEATRGVLRPSDGSTRPILRPETHHASRFGGGR